MAFPTHEQTIKTKGTAKQDNLHGLGPKIGAKLDLHASAANGAVHAGAQPEKRGGGEEEEEEEDTGPESLSLGLLRSDQGAAAA